MKLIQAFCSKKVKGLLSRLIIINLNYVLNQFLMNSVFKKMFITKICIIKNRDQRKNKQKRFCVNNILHDLVNNLNYYFKNKYSKNTDLLIKFVD